MLSSAFEECDHSNGMSFPVDVHVCSALTIASASTTSRLTVDGFGRDDRFEHAPVGEHDGRLEQ
jgi:hypothetical protein